MKGLGLVLIVVGVLGLGAALNMDTTVHVPSQTIGAGDFSANIPAQSVHNLGLMLRQLEWVVVSGLVALSGVLFYGFGQLIEQRSMGTVAASQPCEVVENGFAPRDNGKHSREQRGFASFLMSE